MEQGNGIETEAGNGIDKAFEGRDRLLTVREVMEIMNVKYNTIYRLRRAGRFPEAVKISERAVRWYESDIDEYLKSRPRTK